MLCGETRMEKKPTRCDVFIAIVVCYFVQQRRHLFILYEDPNIAWIRSGNVANNDVRVPPLKPVMGGLGI